MPGMRIRGGAWIPVSCDVTGPDMGTHLCDPLRSSPRGAFESAPRRRSQRESLKSVPPKFGVQPGQKAGATQPILKLQPGLCGSGPRSFFPKRVRCAVHKGPLHMMCRGPLCTESDYIYSTRGTLTANSQNQLVIITSFSHRFLGLVE